MSMRAKPCIVAPERIRWSLDIAVVALRRLDAEILGTGELISDEDLAYMSGMLTVILVSLGELHQFANKIEPSAIERTRLCVKKLP